MISGGGEFANASGRCQLQASQLIQRMQHVMQTKQAIQNMMPYQQGAGIWATSKVLSMYSELPSTDQALTRK